MTLEPGVRSPSGSTRSTVELAAQLRGAWLRPAPVRLRLAAAGLDVLFATTLAAVPVGTALLGLTLAGTASTGHPAMVVALAFAVVVLVGYGVVWPEVGQGRTPGKHAVGVRVVRLDGGHPDARAHAVRWLLLGLDVLGGGLAAVGRRDGRRLGDLVAGTLVVHRR